MYLRTFGSFKSVYLQVLWEVNSFLQFYVRVYTHSLRLSLYLKILIRKDP
jgi:hypothetical protein